MTNPFIQNPDFYDRKINCMWLTGQGKTFHTHGEYAGNEGAWNAEGQVKGIYDSPMQSTWKSGAFSRGAKQKALKHLSRDMKLGFHITETGDSSAEENESAFRNIFEYQVDEYDDDPESTTLHIKTDFSGERQLDLLLYDTPMLDEVTDTDPIESQYFNTILPVRAGDPDWYEYDAAINDDYREAFQNGSTNAEGFILVYNPTDVEMLQKWILTRATWTVPDVSWRGKRYKRIPAGVYANRTLTLQPISDVQGGIVIDLDGDNLMIRDNNYTNALPSLLPNGERFLFSIPPYTPKTLLPISYTDAPAGGARAVLVQPRHWTRPWGQE